MKKESNLKILMEYAGNYKILTYLSWGLSAFSSLIALIPYIYIYKIIEEVLLVAPNFHEATHIVNYAVMAVIYAVASMLIYISGLMCSHISAFRIARNMRNHLIEHIALLPIGLLDNFGTGKARKIIDDSCGATETYLAHQLPDKAGAIATPIGLMGLLVFFDWKLGILSLLPIVLGFCFMMLMTGENMKNKMVEYQNSLGNMSNEAVEYIRGMPVVKTFGQTVFSFKRFKDAIDNYQKWVIAYTIDLRRPMKLYTTAINSVFAFLIAAALFVCKDKITTDFLLNLIFYIIITPIISLTLTKIMMMSENGIIVEDALSRVRSITDLTPLTNTNKHQIDNYSIEYNHVSFSYDGKNKAIDDLSLSIESGETVAFVGPSGGGKSTLASLTSRFYDVNSGSIKIGGHDVKDIDKEELMNKVSFVFQDNHLLKMSILDNILLGKPDASNEEVNEAIKNAQCQDIIDKLPEGLNTIIGSTGVYLSGGQKQRIAIARMLLKNAPIIILDEATAFADPDNEVKIQKALSYLTKGKTVIMIAHRLSTIKNVDHIYLLQSGKIVESGTHQSLMTKGNIYYHMWQQYQQAALWKVTKEVQK